MNRTLYIAAGVLSIPLSSLAHAGSWAAQRHYELPMTEAAWRVHGDRLKCALTQRIPDYGRAVFTQRAGRKVELHLVVRQPLPSSGHAQLRAEPPPWWHNVAARDLGSVAFNNSTSPFAFAGDMPQAIFAALERGLFPTLYYGDGSAGATRVSVSLSAVRFRAALGKFQACTNKLLPMDVDQISKSVVHFPSASALLTTEARKRLDLIIRYLRLDHDIRKAAIVGFTDRSGAARENYLLSQRRAAAVQTYLAKAKLARVKLSVRYYGQARPVADNSTEGGRSANRRVEIRLSR